MPWNQAQKNKPLPPRRNLKLWLTGLVGIILLTSIGVFTFIYNDNEETIEVAVKTKKKKQTSKPKYNAPHQIKKKKIGLTQMTNEERLKWFERKYGTNVPENLKSEIYFLKNPPKLKIQPKARREDIFKHQSERSIASIVLLKPGAFLIQRSVYDDSFDIDFKKALEEPTLFSKDDTPEQRELKEAVNEVKAELAERMRNGEKPSEILTECMNTAYELGKYTRDIEELLYEIEDDPTKSNQDVEDFVNAANKLLRDKGAAELPMPTLFRRQARLKVLARQRQYELNAKQQLESEGNK